MRRRAPKGATHSCLSQKEGARRAAHEREYGGRRLRRRFAAWSHPLGIQEHETHRHRRLPPRQRHAAWPPSGLRRHAVSTGNRFAARPPPQDSASPQVLVNGVEAYATGAGLAASSVLWPRPGPWFYAALPMQRSATTSPTRRRFTPAPGLKTTTAFRPSPPANALRLRRPVAVLRRRQSAAQLYAVVDLYTAIWFVTRMRRLTGADSAQHDLLTISRT